MEHLDTKTLVHMGVELVVIGGITFWFQRKTSIQQEEINQLRETLSKLEELVVEQGKIISQHEMIFRRMTGGMPPPQQPPQSYAQHPQQPPHVQHPPQQQPPRHPPQPPPHVQHPPPQQSPPPADSSSSQSEEEEEDPTEILKEELGSIGGDPEFLEISCNPESCDLKGRKKRSTRSSKLKKRTKVKKS